MPGGNYRGWYPSDGPTPEQQREIDALMFCEIYGLTIEQANTLFAVQQELRRQGIPIGETELAEQALRIPNTSSTAMPE